QRVTIAAGASVTGVVSDDGLPSPTSLSQSWSKINGPGTAEFANANALATQVTFSEPGSYALRLTATDGELSAADDIVIRVVDLVTGTRLVIAGDGGYTQAPAAPWLFT